MTVPHRLKIYEIPGLDFDRDIPTSGMATFPPIEDHVHFFEPPSQTIPWIPDHPYTYEEEKQGHRLFHVAQDGKEALRIPGEAAEFGGQIAGLEAAEKIQRGVTDGSPVVRRAAPENRAAIFVQHHVAHPVHAILDRPPMIADQGGQLGRRGALTRQRGDVVRRLRRGPAVTRALANHAADLCDAGPIEMAIQRDAADQRAAFEPAVSLAGCGERVPFRFTLPLRPGGKTPRAAQRIPARSPAVNRVDSL